MHQCTGHAGAMEGLGLVVAHRFYMMRGETGGGQKDRNFTTITPHRSRTATGHGKDDTIVGGGCRGRCAWKDLLEDAWFHEDGPNNFRSAMERLGSRDGD